MFDLVRGIFSFRIIKKTHRELNVVVCCCRSPFSLLWTLPHPTLEVLDVFVQNLQISVLRKESYLPVLHHSVRNGSYSILVLTLSRNPGSRTGISPEFLLLYIYPL